MICDPERGRLKFHSDVAGPDEVGTIPVHVYCGAESIRREIEGSLRRLGTDYIDLYQTHWQDSTTPVEETMDALMKLKDEGKIRAIGVCNASDEEIERYRVAGTLASDQERFSMLDREMQESRLAYCREHRLGFLAYSPLGRGLLSGKCGPEREFAETDQRHADPRFSQENRRRVAKMLEEIDSVRASSGLTFAQLAVAWSLHQPGVTHALVGARNSQQARENAAAAGASLAQEQLQQIRKAIEAPAASSV
jgi:aryl-alcohol dehydrogenase-like predicted oxidoreductase